MKGLWESMRQPTKKDSHMNMFAKFMAISDKDQEKWLRYLLANDCLPSTPHEARRAVVIAALQDENKIESKESKEMAVTLPERSLANEISRTRLRKIRDFGPNDSWGQWVNYIKGEIPRNGQINTKLA